MIYILLNCSVILPIILGLWPNFTHLSQRQSAQLRVFDANLIDYFSIPNHDGIHITWAHAVNDLEALQKALYGMLLCSKFNDISN